MVCVLNSDPAGNGDLSAEALRGNAKSGNRGLVDVIPMKTSIGPPLPQTADPTRV
jgi:hypothetical protein